MTLYNLTTVTPIQLIHAGDGPTLIVNRDTVNPINIGGTNAVGTSSWTQVSIIDPLGSMTFTGDQDIWGIAISGNPVVDVQQSALYWSPSPAQIAQQISQLSTVLLNKSSTIIPANSTLTLPAVQVTQPGYDISIMSVWNAAIAFGTQLRVHMSWQDKTSGLIYENQEWQIAGAENATPALNTIGSGPTQGNQVVISITNTDTATAAAVSLSFLQNSRSYVKDSWQWNNINNITIPGFNFGIDTFNLAVTGTTGLIAAQAGVNLAAGGFLEYIGVLHSGRVHWDFFESSNNLAPEDFELMIQTPFINGANVEFAELVDIRDLSGAGEFIMPRAPIIIAATNHHATASANFTFHIVGE